MDNLLAALKNLVGFGRWDYSDRRAMLRIPCKIEVQLQKPPTLMGGEVRDMSISGLQVLCYGPIKKGESLKVRVRNCPLQAEFDAVDCKVEWRQKEGVHFLAGLSFAESEQVMSRSWAFYEFKRLGLEAGTIYQKRQFLRVICLLPARLQIGDESRKVTVKDLGLNGARVEATGAPLERGTPVILSFGPLDKMPEIRVAGHVALVRRGRVPHYGLAFERFSTGGPRQLEKYLDFFFTRSS